MWYSVALGELHLVRCSPELRARELLNKAPFAIDANDEIAISGA